MGPILLTLATLWRSRTRAVAALLLLVLAVGYVPSSSAQVGVGVGVTIGHASWSPQKAAGFLGWQEAQPTLLTLSGSAVVAASDASGNGTIYSPTTAGQRPGYDTTALLNGHASFQVTSAAENDLRVTTGGVAGSAAFSMAAVVRLDTLENSFRGFIAMGRPYPSNSSVLGTGNSTQWWAGRTGVTLPVLGSVDATTPHLVEKVVSVSGSNNLVTLFVDGYQTGTTFTDSLDVRDPGFGLMAYAPGLGLGTTSRIWAAMFFSGALDLATQQKLRRWAVSRFAIRSYNSALLKTNIVGYGDSIMYGTGAVHGTSDVMTDADPLFTAAHTTVNVGLPNSTIDDVIARPVDMAQNVSVMAVGSTAVIWVGTNNLNGNKNPVDTPSAALAKVATLCALLRSYGTTRIVLVPMLPTFYTGPAWSSAYSTHADFEAARVAYNAGLAALVASGVADRFVSGILTDVRLQDPTNTSYYNADEIHPIAPGYAVAAPYVAAAVN